MTIHSLMNFCGWKRSPETLSLAILTLLAIIQINHLKKKSQGGKNTVIFIVCTSGGGRINFLNALIKIKGKWSKIQGKCWFCITISSFTPAHSRCTAGCPATATVTL